MDKILDIPIITRDAATRFKNMLENFRLGVSEATGFPERNLSFQFSHAFLRAYENSAVFQEVTFDKRKHLDTLLISDDFAIALECKVLLMRSRAADLKDDAKRLQEIVPLMKKRFKKNSPTKWYTMLLCETWWSEHASWWVGESTKSMWEPLDIIDTYKRDKILLRGDITFDGAQKQWPLFWLYGYREYKDSDTNNIV